MLCSQYLQMTKDQIYFDLPPNLKPDDFLLAFRSRCQYISLLWWCNHISLFLLKKKKYSSKPLWTNFSDFSKEVSGFCISKHNSTKRHRNFYNFSLTCPGTPLILSLYPNIISQWPWFSGQLPSFKNTTICPKTLCQELRTQTMCPL